MTFTAKSANGLKKVKEFIERLRGTTLADTAIKRLQGIENARSLPGSHGCVV